MGVLKESQSRARRFTELVIAGTVVAVLWILLALPILIYHLPQNVPDIPSEGAVKANESVCTPVVYTGTVCKESLQVQQACLTGVGGDDVFVPMRELQQELETQAIRFLSGLQLLTPSEKCSEVIVPFICFSIFGICDSNSRDLYLPSSEDCEILMNDVCGPEFQRAMPLFAMFPTLQVPPCDTFPDVTLECTGNTTDTSDDIPTSGEAPIPGPSNVNVTQALECSDGFYEAGGICQPKCGEWEELPHSVIVITDVALVFQAVVYVVSASVVLVLSCIQHERMFKFPAVFVVYEMFPLLLFEISVLIGYTNRTKLFCKSQNLIESLRAVESSTFFCDFQGALFHSQFLSELILWITHIVAVLWGIKFPFHARSFQQKYYFKYLHVAMVAVAILLPCIVTVPIVIGTGGSAFPFFPPFLCVSKNVDVLFYTFVPPASLILGIGISLLVPIFLILIRRTKTPQRKDAEQTGWNFKAKYMNIKHQFRANAAEIKILIALTYYFLLGAFITAAVTIPAYGFSQFNTDISNYFLCESSGTNPNKVCDREFERFNSRMVFITALLIVGMFPIVNLVYVLNVQELKKILSRRLKRHRTQISLKAITSSENITVIRN